MKAKYKLVFIDMKTYPIQQTRYFKTYLGLMMYLSFFGLFMFTYTWRQTDESDFDNR